MQSVTQFRTGAVLLLAAAALMLSGCFMLPGKFVSELVVDEKGGFGFTYEGEIFFSTFALASSIDERYPELQTYCYDDKSNEERACTAPEIAKQRDIWEEGQLQKKRDKQRMAVILGELTRPNPMRLRNWLLCLSGRRDGKRWNTSEAACSVFGT